MEAARNRRRTPRRRCHRDATPTFFVFNLPEEILIEILTRLPVKSLLKFRCVSKSWCSQISSPSFAKSHLLLLQASDSGKCSSFSNHRLMLTGIDVKDLSLRSLIEQPMLIDSAVSVDYYPGIKHDSWVMLVGSHNGLICIAVDGKDLYLWNPTTRVHARVPPAINKLPKVMPAFGFGYCKSSGDYKVLFISCMARSGRNYESVVQIYSRKSNSWKIMEGYNYKNARPQSNSGEHVNGKLHFAMEPAFVGEVWWDIVYIDLDSETDGIIVQPDYGMGRLDLNSKSVRSLAVLGGCLSVLFNHYFKQDGSLDLWVLKEYGVKESWTKLYTIDSTDAIQQWWYAYWTPLTVLPTGEILLLDKAERRFAFYNTTDNSWTYPEIKNRVSYAVMYVESLISPLLNTN